jgi:hypothetical protein
MKPMMLAAMLLLSILDWRGAAAHASSLRVIAEFPGVALKWVKIADVEFARQKLDKNNYKIVVVDTDASIVVILDDLEKLPGTRGSSGKYPGYEVEIRKSDLAIVRSNFVR